jgi:hypothetical protein
VLLLVPGCVTSRPPGNSQRDEAIARSLDDSERLAVLNQDLVALERLWSDDFTVNAPSNTVSIGKQQVLAAVSRGLIHYSLFDRTVEFIRFGDGIAIVMGAETVKPIGDAPMAGQTVRRRFTNIWRNEAGTWRMFARHANVIAEPPPAPPDAAADIVELSSLETVWNEAHVRGDAEALDRLWARELTVAVPRMAVIKRDAAMNIWQSGRMRFQRYETSDIEVRPYGDAAVVTGRVKRAREVNGSVVEDDWRFTKTYVRRGGRWQVVSFHASDAPQ